MSGLNPVQLLELAVRPALAIMGPAYSTPAAEQLVMGTAAQESGLVYLKQLGKGPALGLFQMEPPTFHDLLKRLDEHRDRSLYGAVISFMAGPSTSPMEMCWNLRLAAAMCRLKYRDDPHPLPQAGDVHGMAVTWKRCYNSHLGAGKVEDFERSWGNLIAPHVDRMWP